LEAVQYKCPNCCAELKFDAAKQLFGCEYCRSLFTEPEIKQVCKRNEEIDLSRSLEERQIEDEFVQHTGLYVCQSCGAQIMAEEETAATFCYYCHNPVILQGRLSGEFKPSQVLPFQMSREMALSSFQAWCKKRWFVPRDFKSDQQLEKMVGLYVPFWVADCNVKADVNAIGKKVRSWSSGNYRYTETKEYQIHRCATVDFNGIPADGSKRIEDELMEAIEPFDYTQACNFSMAYLSGFMADKYDVDKSGVFPKIRNRAIQGTDAAIRGTMKGYNSVSVTSSSMNVLRTDWKYMLLPVWFATFHYKGKVYEFAINGQTGKQAGAPPLDKKKLALFCAAIGIGIALLGTVGGWLIC